MMRYSVEYQYLEKGAQRPTDDGEVVGIRANDEAGLVILPNVGDYVHIDNSSSARASFNGKVKSRAFFYIGSSESISCHVNIVVEETEESEWAKLIKE
jgi:hypothetical protein